MDNVFVNKQAEMAVLGAALRDPDSADKVAKISAEDFYEPANRAIYSAIRVLCDRNDHVDLVTVNAELEKAGAEFGGFSYLVDCAQACVAPTAGMQYVSILQECAMRRRLYEAGKELCKRAGEGDSEPDETRDWASRTLKDIRLGDAEKLIPLEQALLTTFCQIEDDYKSRDTGSRILSGIATLDNKLGGLRGGEYVAIGARPSVGKSILALTFCVNAARQGKRVLLVSLEMNEVQITERLMAEDSGVALNRITSGNVEDEEWLKLSESLTMSAKLKLWYSLEATTVEKVRKAAYQLYENGGLDMIAVDYLQLMDATYSKRQSRQEQISEISRGLRKLAAELKIPILVLTQLNRASVNERVDGKKTRREPTMSEARESGAIEQDANIFILLHDPDRDEMRTDSERETWDKIEQKGMTMMRLIIDKNRQGKRGRVTVAFDGDHMKFYPVVRKE